VAPPDLTVDDLDVIPAVTGEDDVESLLPASAVALSGEVVAAADGESGAGGAAAVDEGPARLRAGRERVFGRRIAAKAVEVAAASEADRRTLAGLLGCAADPVTPA
jgi:ABC-type phosphonate transport system ATPase subunit